MRWARYQPWRFDGGLMRRLGRRTSAAQPPLSGLISWWRADLGVETSGSSVTTWNDQVGPNHLTAEGAPNLNPLFGPNGRPGIAFDDVDDALVRASFDGGVSRAQGVSFFVVVRANSGIDNGDVCFYLDEATSPLSMVYLFATSRWRVDAGSVIINAQTDSAELAEDMYLISRWNDSERHITTPDGTVDAAAGLGVTEFDPSNISGVGIGRNTGSDYARVIVSEAGVYDKMLSDAESESLAGYLALRYAL